MPVDLPTKKNALKFITTIMILLLVVTIHGLLLYLFFHQKKAPKQIPYNIPPLEISVIQLKPKQLNTAQEAAKHTILNHNVPSTKQPSIRMNTQAITPQASRKLDKAAISPKQTAQQATNLATKKIETTLPSNQSIQLSKPSQSKVEKTVDNRSHPTSMTPPVSQPINQQESKAQNLTNNIGDKAAVNTHQSAQNQPITTTTPQDTRNSLLPSNATVNAQIANTATDTTVNTTQQKPQTSQSSTNISPKPTQPIMFSNSDVSWHTMPNTQLPPNLSRLVTLKKLSSLQVKIAVNTQGNVESCSVTQSSGDGDIDAFICQRLQKAKLHPKIINGVNVASIGNLTINLKS